MSSSSSRSDIDARAVRLKEVFFAEDSRLLVPEYQREYSWKREQLEAFWEDLVGPKANSNFSGTVLLLNTDTARKEIVDGQQRATTTTILLSVLRDVASTVGSLGIAQNIQENDIQCKDPDTFMLNEYRLKTSLSSRAFFEANIQRFPTEPSVPVTREEKRIMDAYNYFSAQIEEHLDSETQADQALMRIRAKVRELTVVCIEVFNDEAKFDIFESVNARGLSLSPADLIKNHLLSKTPPSEQSSTNQRWIEFSAKSEEVGLDLTDVLRYDWNGQNGFVGKSALFQSLKSSISSSELAVQYINRVELAVESIEILRTRDEKEIYNSLGWQQKHKHTFLKSLELINMLGVKQHFALFMSIYRERDKIPGGIAARISDVSCCFCVAHFGLMQGPGNRVERLFSRLARGIRNACEGEESTRPKKLNQILADVENEFAKRWPSSDELIAKLSDITYDGTSHSKSIIRVLLAGIEMSRTGQSEISINWPRVNIEHIQPQNPSDPEVKAKFEQYVHSVGNLVLLQDRINKIVGNKPPNEKAPKLMESQFLITREVAKEIMAHGWSPEQIKTRSAGLVEAGLSLYANPKVS